MKPVIKKIIGATGAVAVLALLFVLWKVTRPKGPGDGFVSGNGRLEATEVDIATKLAGRVEEILVNEGDFVAIGQVLAVMNQDVLTAQRDEGQAQYRQAINAVSSAEAQVTARKSDEIAAQEMVGQRESELDAMQRRLARTESLAGQGILPAQQLDDDRAHVRGAEAVVSGAQAQVAAAKASIAASQAEAVGAGSQVAAMQASIARIQADIEDSRLTSPRIGRVQYRIAQPGEVLAAGGKVLNLVDLGDVYMTFFLPETVVGRVALGSDVHIVLDAALHYVIPAKVSYVASTAQFTPKTVETATERQKLMFRVKAQIDPELLKKHREQVKTGLPGVAWLKLNGKDAWPAALEIKVPE